MKSVKKSKQKAVIDYVLTYIDQNKFTSNTKIPSEVFLTKRLSVCRETVRRALRTLEDEGLLYAVHGGGTYFDKHKALTLSAIDSSADFRIAIIIQGTDRGANSILVSSVKEYFSPYKVDIRIFYTDNKLSNERRCLLSCSEGFDGIIIDGVKASMANPNLDVYSSLYQKNIPFIFYNNYYSETGYPKILNDDEMAAENLISALTQKGHKHIAGLFLYDNYQGVKKYQGYAKSVFKHSCVFDDEYVKFFLTEDLENKDKLAKEIWNFLRKIPSCTAVCCCNVMLYQALKVALNQHGKKIGEDISVVCFDYSLEDYDREGITCTVSQSNEMGKVVASTLLDMMRDPEYKKKEYSRVIPCSFHQGSSIKDIR